MLGDFGIAVVAFAAWLAGTGCIFRPWFTRLSRAELAALLWCLPAGPRYWRALRARVRRRQDAELPDPAFLPGARAGFFLQQPCGGRCAEADDLRRRLDAVTEQARLGAAAAGAREKHLREQLSSRIVVTPDANPDLSAYFTARPLDTAELDQAVTALSETTAELDQALRAVFRVPPFVFSGIERGAR